MNIGERVRILRKSLGLTQAEFAEKLGITQGFLSKVEKDRANFTLDHIIAIRNIFGVNTSDLIEGQPYGRKMEEGQSILVKEIRVGYAAPKPASKEAAIKRIVVILEGMTEQRVFEILKYAEEKNELIYLQAVGRGSRKKES